MTKVQFTKKVEKLPQEDTFYGFNYEAPTFGGQEPKEEKSEKLMLGTSHTSNKTESMYENQRKEDALVHINTKFNKKAESCRPNAISNSDNLD